MARSFRKLLCSATWALAASMLTGRPEACSWLDAGNVAFVLLQALELPTRVRAVITT